MEEAPERLLPFSSLRGRIRLESGQPQVRKTALTRKRVCQHLDLELASLQNSEKEKYVV